MTFVDRLDLGVAGIEGIEEQLLTYSKEECEPKNLVIEGKDETIIVLSAAIAAYLGSSAEGLRIVSVKPVSRALSAWALAGRMDIIAGRQ